MQADTLQPAMCLLNFDSINCTLYIFYFKFCAALKQLLWLLFQCRLLNHNLALVFRLDNKLCQPTTVSKSKTIQDKLLQYIPL